MAPSSHVSFFPVNKTKLWTGPVQMTYLHVGVHGGEEAKFPCCSQETHLGSRFLGTQHLGKSWWTCSPACPTGQSSTGRQGMRGAANHLQLVYQVMQQETDSGTVLGKSVRRTPICGGEWMLEPNL